MCFGFRVLCFVFCVLCFVFCVTTETWSRTAPRAESIGLCLVLGLLFRLRVSCLGVGMWCLGCRLWCLVFGVLCLVPGDWCLGIKVFRVEG